MKGVARLSRGASVAMVMCAVAAAGCAARSTTPAESTGEGEDSRIEFRVESEGDGLDETDPDVVRGWDAEGVEVPEGPAGVQLRWVLDRLEAGGELPDLDEASERFSEAFLEQVPPRRLGAVLRQLSGTLGAFVLRDLEPGPDARWVVGVIEASDGNLYRVVVGLAEGSDDRMQTLLVQLAPDRMMTDAGDWDGVHAVLAQAGAEVSLLAAELTDAGCEVVRAEAADRPLAVGSTFKIWVLGALVEAVVAGDVSWDDPLAVRDAWKSIPSGVMQDAPDGAVFSLMEHATEMIRISDNTATDHLIHHLGRERVEEAMAGWGVRAPERNRPLLTTREMTGLKLPRASESLEAWRAGDEAARRALLASEPVDFDLMAALEAAGPWTTPRAIDTLEWFASAEDLCRAMDRARDLSLTVDEARPMMEILGMNPGLPFDRERWPYVGYKGGSEPGVLNMTWLMLRGDGRWFVLVLTANDAAQPVADSRLMSAAATAIRLLGEVP